VLEDKIFTFSFGTSVLSVPVILVIGGSTRKQSAQRIDLFFDYQNKTAAQKWIKREESG
jgi:hypothetical protein